MAPDFRPPTDPSDVIPGPARTRRRAAFQADGTPWQLAPISRTAPVAAPRGRADRPSRAARRVICRAGVRGKDQYTD